MYQNYFPPGSESSEQMSLFRWAAYNMGAYPDLKWMYHIPNGGKRSITTAKRLKAEGVKPGVPDIHLPVPKGKYHGLYIEMKAGRNKTTALQEEWLIALGSNGYSTAICYGWEEAVGVLKKYLDQEG